MKRAILFVLCAAVIACSKSSPTEPVAVASLSGQVQLCGFDNLSSVTVADSRGTARTTSLDAQGNFSFGAVFATGAYTMTATRPPLPSKTHTGSRLLVAGANQEFWISLGCPTLSLGLNANCTALLVSVSGEVTEVASGWKTPTATLAPPNGSVKYTLANPGTYRVLFNGTYKDGRKPQWDFNREIPSFGNDFQLFGCPATFLRGGPTEPTFR